MGTEELKAIVEIINGLSGDAITGLKYYLIFDLLGHILTQGTLLLIFILLYKFARATVKNMMLIYRIGDILGIDPEYSTGKDEIINFIVKHKDEEKS
jgi:hypothetical protein